MLTIFAVPKAFHGHIEIIQRNAIKSWTLIRPRPEILLLGDDQGTEEVAREFGLRHCSGIARNEFGTPLVSDIFNRALKEATHNLFCYTNSDIILPSSLSETITKVRRPRFLIIGQRWNLDIETALSFEDPDWEKKLNDRRKADAKLFTPDGIDYFIFTRGCYENILPFAIGRTVWDNWLVFKARLTKIPVVDATQAITVIHQNHGYGTSDAKEAIWKGPEARANLELAGGYVSVFDLNDANFLLTSTGLKRRRLTKYRVDRELYLRAMRYPEYAFLFRMVQKILKPASLWHSLRSRARRILTNF